MLVEEPPAEEVNGVLNNRPRISFAKKWKVMFSGKERRSGNTNEGGRKEEEWQCK